MENITARLSAHAGSEIISRSALSTIQPPQGTDTHKPIAHGQLVDMLESELKIQGLVIEEEQYSVMTQGMKLFGVMKLRMGSFGTSNEYRMALGLRASNDKKFPVELISGANVFVCDNMCFNGEVIALKRRHTKLIDIRMELAGGVQKALEGFYKTETLVYSWKSKEISDLQAKGLILDAGIRKVMPLHLVPDVWQNWQEPKHQEFEGRTVWSLHNAFTESFKLLKPHVAMESATELAGMLQGAAHIPLSNGASVWKNPAKG